MVGLIRRVERVTSGPLARVAVRAEELAEVGIGPGSAGLVAGEGEVSPVTARADEARAVAIGSCRGWARRWPWARWGPTMWMSWPECGLGPARRSATSGRRSTLIWPPRRPEPRASPPRPCPVAHPRPDRLADQPDRAHRHTRCPAQPDKARPRATLTLSRPEAGAGSSGSHGQPRRPQETMFIDDN